jgi:hypothetical protein
MKKKIDIPDDMMERIERMAIRTWGAIAYDVLDMIAYDTERRNYASQAEVVEMVGDADRMQMFGDDQEAYNFTRQLSWDDMKKILKKVFPSKRYYG